MTQRLARVVSVFGSAASTEASSPQANRPDAMVATLARVEAHLDDLIAQSRNDDETRSLALSQRLITEMSRRMQLMESGAHSAGGLE